MDQESFGQLEEKTRNVKAHLRSAERSIAKSDEHRLAAALELVEARKLAKAAKVAWRKWCLKHFDRSIRDINKLVAIGSSDNPHEALIESREKRKALKHSEKSGAPCPTLAIFKAEDGQQKGGRAPESPPPTLAIADGTKPADPLAALKAAAEALDAAGVREAIIYLIDRLSAEDRAKLARNLARQHGLIARTDEDQRRDAPSPPPSSEDKRQAEPAHKPSDGGAGMPSGRGGPSSGEGNGHADAATAGNRAGDSFPHAADPANPNFDIPDKLRRTPTKDLPAE